MKFSDCMTCANEGTDPAICRKCDNADQFTPINDDEATHYISLDELRSWMNQ